MQIEQKVSYIRAGELRALGKHKEADAIEEQADAMTNHEKRSLGASKKERAEEIKRRMEQEK